jgi:hypothetical protein
MSCLERSDTSDLREELSTARWRTSESLTVSQERINIDGNNSDFPLEKLIDTVGTHVRVRFRSPSRRESQQLNSA